MKSHSPQKAPQVERRSKGRRGRIRQCGETTGGLQTSNEDLTPRSGAVGAVHEPPFVFTDDC